MNPTRTETDSLGPRLVPADAVYGVQTTRSIENFPFTHARLPLEIIRGMAILKLAAARTNARLGQLPKEKEEAIAQACEEVLSGTYDDEFPLPVYQAGSGTSSHMNLNEVLAHLANETLGGKRGDKAPVHPNDDVNRGQSTNNMFPSGAKVALILQLPALVDALSILTTALLRKADEFSSILKSGRTHLQDAVPVTLGQEFGAWAHAVSRQIPSIEKAADRLRELGAGGNAVGTGVNTKPTFRAELVQALNEATGEMFRPATNGIHLTQFMTDFASFSAALRSAALDVQQVANNLRLLASGPNTGIGEIRLPAVEPGSSIMPGKINPSICEAVNMACIQIQGLDAAVAMACGAGQLELNTHMPLIGTNVLRAAQWLTEAARVLAEKCIAGITADVEACRRHLENSAGLPTLLNPRLGYDQVAQLVKEALAEGRTLHQVAVEKGLLTEAEYDALIASSTGPNL
ncbi:MAG: aspartate ammonia-lyase [Verrucomicrobiota bacterium]|jgi:aspartate ammonia-lyase|nr:aspartate ammonia-lyase [Verrucomicrobiota bacterium]